MSTIIAIDIGNSYTKIDLFGQQLIRQANNEIISSSIPFDYSIVRQIAACQEVQLSVSSVVLHHTSKKLIAEISRQLALKNFSIKIWNSTEILTLAQIKNHHELTHFGSDRALRIYYLNTSPAKTIKISCGCGSAFTVEVVQNSLLLESYILPGLAMQLKSLNQNTARLPLITVQEIPKLLKTINKFSTVYSIINGILKSYYALIEKLIIEYEPTEFILSGGYAALLAATYPGNKQKITVSPTLELEILTVLATHNMQKI